MRTNTVGVVFEDDEDFGDISSCPVDNDKFHDELDKIDFSNLSDDRAHKLKQLIVSFSDIFSDKPGSCNTSEHEIRLTPDFPPKKQVPYRIPSNFVMRLIGRLLNYLRIRKLDHLQVLMLIL
jgi:hypothetical protein